MEKETTTVTKVQLQIKETNTRVLLNMTFLPGFGGGTGVNFGIDTSPQSPGLDAPFFPQIRTRNSPLPPPPQPRYVPTPRRSAHQNAAGAPPSVSPNRQPRQRPQDLSWSSASPAQSSSQQPFFSLIPHSPQNPHQSRDRPRPSSRQSTPQHSQPTASPRSQQNQARRQNASPTSLPPQYPPTSSSHSSQQPLSRNLPDNRHRQTSRQTSHQPPLHMPSPSRPTHGRQESSPTNPSLLRSAPPSNLRTPQPAIQTPNNQSPYRQRQQKPERHVRMRFDELPPRPKTPVRNCHRSCVFAENQIFFYSFVYKN